MQFNEIILTRSELSALKFLNESSAVIVEDSNREDLERLKFFDFVEFYTITDPKTRKIAVEKTSRFAPQGARITNLGKSYLTYLHGKHREQWRDRAYGFVSGIAVTVIAQLIFHALTG